MKGFSLTLPAVLTLLIALSSSGQVQASSYGGSNWLADLFDGKSAFSWNGRDDDRDSDRDDDNRGRDDEKWDRDHDNDWDKHWNSDWDRNWSGTWKKDWDDYKRWGYGNGHNGKWFICHRTGSRQNPYVIIEVSTSGKHAHLAHGDWLSFSDKGNGRCGGGSTPDPKITSLALGSAEIAVNTSTTITWASTDATSCKLDGKSVATSGTAAVGPYSSTGYKSLTLSCSGPGGSDTESVKLKVVSAPAVPPEVTVTLEPSQIAIGAKARLSWSSTGAKSCKLEGSGSLYAQSFSVWIDDSGYYMKGPFTKAGQATYTVTCTGPGGTDSASVTLTVGSSPPAQPAVTLSLAANSIMQNTGTTTATWTSTNAQACSLTNGGVTSGVALNGSAQVGPFSASGTQTVTINCTGATGTTPATASKALTVTAPAPAPTVTFTIAADEIVVGTGTTTAIWSSTNATSCTLGNGGTSGSVTVGPFAATGLQTLAITCSGPGGSTSQSVEVTVINQPPAPTQQLCMTTDMVGNGMQVWIVEYNLQTGEFTGAATTPGEPALSGGVVPAGNGAIPTALFAPGTAIDVEAGGVLGLSSGLTYSNGDVGPNGYAQYQIELFDASAPSQGFGNTRLIVHGAALCTELGGLTPRPR
ncbi:MAG TPA: hypothetical protein VGE69_10580 [Pseudomonadales bacterium]